MVIFKLHVSIALNQLPILKEGKFNLCIAKQVNGVYTVVWSALSNYLVHQTFEWVEEYQVFGEKKFQLDALTNSASTNAVDIKFGQTSVLSSYGVMQHATGTPDKSGLFSVKNEYGPISIGVNGKIDGGFKPIFVSPTVVTGTGRLDPVNSVKVWFSAFQKSSAMMFDWDSEGIELTYTDGVTEKAVEYGGPGGIGQWIVL